MVAACPQVLNYPITKLPNYPMLQSLNLVFCGTPQFAVPTLERLVEAGFQIAARGNAAGPTQRSRPRSCIFAGEAVCALKLRLPLIQPESIKNNADFRAQLTALKPDAIIVVGYGRIIPQWMLDLPPLGNINLHASLLPKYRGAAPIQWAIARGESVTGVTTMKIDAGLDTGDILLQQTIPIAPDRHIRNSCAEACGHWIGPDGHNAARFADRYDSSAPARSRASHARTHPQKGGWAR